MIGCYDFCGHYEWTFAWLEENGGIELVRDYWEIAVSYDSQRHARALIVPDGIEGMRKYWQHTLEEEAAGFAFTSTDERFRIDMYECPSKGFLIANDLEQYSDYCDHCMGWCGPLMRDAGFVIDHEHNHHGQCWWEMRKKDDPSGPLAPGVFAGSKDVRLRLGWDQAIKDVYEGAIKDSEKTVVKRDEERPPDPAK